MWVHVNIYLVDPLETRLGNPFAVGLIMLRNGILVVILRPSMRVEDRYVYFIEIYDRMLNRISDTYSRYRGTSFLFSVKGTFEQNYITKIINIVPTIIQRVHQ